MHLHLLSSPPGEDCWAPVPLEGIAVSVTVRGFVAQVKATLRYKNDCKSPMEVRPVLFAARDSMRCVCYNTSTYLL